MKVVLIGPRRKTLLFSDDTENLGLGYLATYLRSRGHEVVVIDAELEGLSDEATVERVLLEQPGLVGVSILFQLVASQPLSFIRKLRQAGVKCHITLGGHFPTFAYEQILTQYPEVDSIVRGEGEETIAELVERIEAQRDWRDVLGVAYRSNGEAAIIGQEAVSEQTVVANPCRALITDLDTLPWPARDTLRWVIANGGKPCVSTSRGCYGSCTFCSISSFYGLSAGRRWRPRSPLSVVGEIERLVDDYGVRDFWVVDDTFIGPGTVGRQRAAEIAELLLARNLKVSLRVSCRADEIDAELFGLLKRAGVTEVFLGLEAGTQRSLDVFQKNTTVEQNEQAVKVLRKVGLGFSIGFILLHPYTDFGDLVENLSFLRRIGYPLSAIPVAPTDLMPRLQVLVGTPLAERLKSEGRLKGDYLDYSYEFSDPLVNAWYLAARFMRARILPLIQFVRRWRRRGLERAFADRL